MSTEILSNESVLLVCYIWPSILKVTFSILISVKGSNYNLDLDIYINPKVTLSGCSKDQDIFSQMQYQSKQ